MGEGGGEAEALGEPRVFGLGADVGATVGVVEREAGGALNVETVKGGAVERGFGGEAEVGAEGGFEEGEAFHCGASFFCFLLRIRTGFPGRQTQDQAP